MAHVVVTEGLVDRDFVAQRCEGATERGQTSSRRPRTAPRRLEADHRRSSGPASRSGPRLYAAAPNAAIYYGLGVTEHSQGSTMVMGMANLAMATGNIGREGVGVNPLRGQNNVQGSCDMGSFPHELPGYRHVSDDAVREIYREPLGHEIRAEPGLRIPNMFDAAIDGSYKGLFVQGEDIAQSDPNVNHVTAALSRWSCVVVQDLFLNETSKFAHVLLPGTSFLEKDGTFTNAERRINRVRPVMKPKTGKHEWQIVCEIAQAMGYPMHYDNAAQIMDEIAATTPTFAGVSFDLLDEVGSVQWPCNEDGPAGHADRCTSTVSYAARVLRRDAATYRRREAQYRKFPLIFTTGRILSQYNVGAQTRRTANVEWHPEDILEIHPQDAEERGINDGDGVDLDQSRVGETHAARQDRRPDAAWVWSTRPSTTRRPAPTS